MMLYSKCNNVYKEYMFGKWSEVTCIEKVLFSGRCYKCKKEVA